jgi:hypothetical protein
MFRINCLCDVKIAIPSEIPSITSRDSAYSFDEGSPTLGLSRSANSLRVLTLFQLSRARLNSSVSSLSTKDRGTVS